MISISKPGTTGIKRIINAASFSLKGFRFAFQDEAAFRQELALTILLVPAAIWRAETGVELALLVGNCLIVLIAEFLNSAIEAIVERIGTDRKELSGAAKDMGSAAVSVSLILVVLVWTVVAWP